MQPRTIVQKQRSPGLGGGLLVELGGGGIECKFARQSCPSEG